MAKRAKTKGRKRVAWTKAHERELKTHSRKKTPVTSIAIVFNADAMHTGLPPNVDACAPGFQSIKSARATHAPSGKPDAMPFAMQTADPQ